MCTIIIVIASATRDEDKLERKNREDAHQTENKKRGKKHVLYNMLLTATSDSHTIPHGEGLVD